MLGLKVLNDLKIFFGDLIDWLFLDDDEFMPPEEDHLLEGQEKCNS